MDYLEPEGRPDGVLLQRLMNCDTLRDAIFMATSHARFQLLWEEHKLSIIWCIGRRGIPRFEEALLAASNLPNFSSGQPLLSWLVIN